MVSTGKGPGQLAAVGDARERTVRLPGGTAGRADVVPAFLGIDDTDDPADVIDALVLARFIEGTQPHSASARLDAVRQDKTLLPGDAKVLRTAREPSREPWPGSGVTGAGPTACSTRRSCSTTSGT